jgi:hypothetical protein
MPDSWDSWDEKLLKTTNELLPAAVPTGRGTWVLTVLLFAAIVAVYVVLWGLPTPGKTSTGEPSKLLPEMESLDRMQPLGGDAMSVTLTPLDESDTFVRDLVRRLSSHPSVVAWLATDNLIRTLPSW